jgi:hypothetical protein
LIYDLSFRWWSVLISSVVFAFVAIWGLKYTKGFPITLPAKMLSLGAIFVAIGILLGYVTGQPIADVLSLKTVTAGSPQTVITVWWAAMVYGYALTIDGIVGCVVSAAMLVLRSKHKS